jgi:hypothetical protein
VTDEASGDRRGWIEIEFVCTNTGAHRPYRLLQAMIGPGPLDFDPLTYDTSFRPADRETLFLGGRTFDEFYCAGCGRNPRIGHAKFVRLLRRLHQEGVGTLDISHLPF